MRPFSHLDIARLIAGIGFLLLLPGAFSQALNTSISSFDMALFPEVHLFVQVTDSAGNTVTGLTESDFDLSENGVPAFLDLTTAYFGGASFGLALDCSGSMSGFESQVINACTTFVSTLRPLDQAAVIFFSYYGATMAVQQMTNDHEALNNAILGYYANGGTALWYGYTLALDQTQDEIPPRVMIGFTDGQDNSSGSYTQATVTYFANTIGAPVHSIGLGSVYPTPLIQVANATGGTYIQTTPDSLWYYYQDIQQLYHDQYEIAYISPDPNFNGAPRLMEITATYLGETDSDTVSFNAPWVSNFAPSITLTPYSQDTLLAAMQASGSPLVLSAWITDNDILATTLVRHRQLGELSYNYGVMTRLSDSLYTFTFSSRNVQPPGIEFYILACDGYNHAITSPTYLPGQYPYQIAVAPNEKPLITHTPVNNWPQQIPLTLSCQVQDITLNPASGKVFFRHFGEIFWSEAVMTNPSGNLWQGTIPATEMYASLEYFLRLWDNYGTYDTHGPHPVNVGVSALEITLIPYNPPIQIPASGGVFSYNINVANNEAAPLTFDGWTTATLPNGSQFGPVLGPINLTLPAGSSLGRDRNQAVPAAAPAGNYSYNGYVGIYSSAIWDSANFPFEKLTTGQGAPVGEWANTGASFDPWIMELGASLPAKLTLHSIYPNPFNPSATIRFELPQAELVRLEVFDCGGRSVGARLASPAVGFGESDLQGWHEAGMHEIAFDGSNLPSGIYFVRLTAGDYQAVQKMVLLK